MLHDSGKIVSAVVICRPARPGAFLQRVDHLRHNPWCQPSEADLVAFDRRRFGPPPPQLVGIRMLGPVAAPAVTMPPAVGAGTFAVTAARHHRAGAVARQRHDVGVTHELLQRQANRLSLLGVMRVAQLGLPALPRQRAPWHRARTAVVRPQIHPANSDEFLQRRPIGLLPARVAGRTEAGRLGAHFLAPGPPHRPGRRAAGATGGTSARRPRAATTSATRTRARSPSTARR